MAEQVGQATLRAENVSKAIKGFALQEFKLKQVLMNMSSSAWTETYFRETATELTATGEGESIQGVSRGAAFPNVDPSWTELQGRHLKFAAESTISIEDAFSDKIDVKARTMLRVARSIANQVDSYIYTELSGASGINTDAASATWDNADATVRDPIRDILTGIEFMAVDNYDALQNGFLLLSPLDYTNLLMNSKVINNPSFKTADVVSNGVVGMIAGLKIIVSNTVTADEALIVIGQRAATWQTAKGLTTAVIENEGIDFTIRSWEIGQVQVTDPEAIHRITNTQS